jgi:RNA polymerase sigma factor (sigma-70 family)
MSDDPRTADLVTRARAGDQKAWNGLVDEFAPLVLSICRRYRLSPEDANEVGQEVWMRLVVHLRRLREPAALPGWLATTTRNECLRWLQADRRRSDTATAYHRERVITVDPPVDTELLAAERNAALRTAFRQLPANCQELLSNLIVDPPPRYAEIADLMGLSAGSLGPLRARCIAKIQQSPLIASLLEESDTAQVREGRT